MGSLQPSSVLWNCFTNFLHKMGARRLASFKFHTFTLPLSIILLVTLAGGQNSEDRNESMALDPYVVGYSSSKTPAIELDGFEVCDKNECHQVCGSTEAFKAFCDPKNPKLCMCSVEKFMSSNVEGIIIPVNRENPLERNCSTACQFRNSYARIWHRNDYSKSCTCLLNQITKSGLTLCDEFALQDRCKVLCQSESATCAFNGICLCRKSWPDVFYKKLKNIRIENQADNGDCSKRCREYNAEYVARIYDSRMGNNNTKKGKYEFTEKYCLCGDEEVAEDQATMKKLQEQGFQQCTTLKCKMRCGMVNEAECEPHQKRSCLCPRNNIFIGKYLWARLPSKKETTCVESCTKNSLAPRVIEWNPFFDPRKDRSLNLYRTSRFPYVYDGKFCHCINLRGEPDINQFRPCTNELCQWLCGHADAHCDEKTRRACICNTHQMAGGLGRKPDPGEINCNVVCRRNLNDARVLEVIWDVPAPSWSVPKAKFCGCVRPVSPSGLSHCDGMEGKDLCPKMCNNPAAYCTEQKVCECDVQPDILEDPMVRIPNGKEAIECGEICRSWTWPLVEDLDHQPFIYDEGRKDCAANNSCPNVDTSPWRLDTPGALEVSIDALEESPNDPKKYCLCAKTQPPNIRPGFKMHFTIESPRQSKTLPCIFNYACFPVGDTMHVV